MRDSSGVIVSSGDLGLLQIRPASFPGEKLIVLVRRASASGAMLELRATGLGKGGGRMVVFSTAATPQTTSWGAVVFEANSKPLGNVGCWRLSPFDAPTDDAGIVIDLGSL